MDKKLGDSLFDWSGQIEYRYYNYPKGSIAHNQVTSQLQQLVQKRFLFLLLKTNAFETYIDIIAIIYIFCSLQLFHLF